MQEINRIVAALVFTYIIKNLHALYVREESQAVVLSELNQSSLCNLTYPQPYETVGSTSHEYEDPGKFQEEVKYEEIGPPITRPPKRKYTLTSCPAYAPSDVSRR